MEDAESRLQKHIAETELECRDQSLQQWGVHLANRLEDDFECINLLARILKKTAKNQNCKKSEDILDFVKTISARALAKQDQTDMNKS